MIPDNSNYYSTNHFLGVAYITFEKISEAAKAMEEMSGKYLPDYPKPLKVSSMSIDLGLHARLPSYTEFELTFKN